jgi:serine-type D-Ala-D-Ala carboxypeptidase/endopeptidase (penicillin-binding protein 4)
LISEGIAVDGCARNLDEYRDKSKYLHDPHRMAIHVSPPLADIVQFTNVHSDNFFAEMIYRTLGQKRDGVGTFESGSHALVDFLKRAGAPIQNVRPVDGSGLSRDNRVTAQALVAALRVVDAAPWRETYRDSFPVAGKTGTLKHRLASVGGRGHSGPRIVAKTGYIKGVNALSGWAEPQGGGEYRFSILLNSGDSNTGISRSWVDSVAQELTK